MLLFNVTDIVWEIDEGYDVSELPAVVNVPVPDIGRKISSTINLRLTGKLRMTVTDPVSDTVTE